MTALQYVSEMPCYTIGNSVTLDRSSAFYLNADVKPKRLDCKNVPKAEILGTKENIIHQISHIDIL